MCVVEAIGDFVQWRLDLIEGENYIVFAVGRHSTIIDHLVDRLHSAETARKVLITNRTRIRR
jgi:hypothetical protein